MIRNLYAQLYRMSIERPHRFLRLMIFALAAVAAVVMTIAGALAK